MKNQPKDTKVIIEELHSIDFMERGKLTSEYRTRFDADGTEITLGPYYKLQAREDGKNKSRRVPAKDVPTLEKDIASFQKFKSLVSSLENTIISNTREHRKSSSEAPSKEESKKNSTKK